MAIPSPSGGRGCCTALHANGKGRLVTLEGSQALAERSRWTLGSLSLGQAEVRQGYVEDTFDQAVADLAPVDWAFLDGNHHRAPTLEYANRLLQSAAPETVRVFDDINWSDGMNEAWIEVLNDPRYQVAFDLRSVGIAVAPESATKRQNVQIGYC